MSKIFQSVLILCACTCINGSFSDYFKSIGSYFGYPQQTNELEPSILDQHVPYEVSATDEKFIQEAAKLTDLALSELDSCQHRVILKLQTACHKLNDEQLAKMAVMLLNCQSAVEGRRIYPCTDAMSIKDCTSSMDADTWNSYHLMSNRARAVCYAVRQAQFRGLTELTINKLMDAANSHLKNLATVAEDQQKLQEVAEETLQTLTQGQEDIQKQQVDLQKAQFHGQLVVEDNIRRILDEKRLITESHKELAEMTRSVQEKLENANKQLQQHSGEAKLNHQELLDDLIAIQNKAQVIFQRIDDSSKLLLEQSEMARLQYEATLAQLAEVNVTVHSLVTIVGTTKQTLEEHLLWLASALGGTDKAIERLYVILWHTVFLLVAMICCAFLTAKFSTRLVVSFLVPLNLIASLQGSEHAMDPMGLVTSLGVFVLTQTLLLSILSFQRSDYALQPLSWFQKLTPKKSKANLNAPTSTSTSLTNSALNNHTRLLTSQKYESQRSHFQHSYNKIERESESDSDDTTSSSIKGVQVTTNSRYRSRTPSSAKLNGSLRNPCKANTRTGAACKMNSLPGRDYCHRHQGGNSEVHFE